MPPSDRTKSLSKCAGNLTTAFDAPLPQSGLTAAHPIPIIRLPIKKGTKCQILTARSLEAASTRSRHSQSSSDLSLRRRKGYCFPEDELVVARAAFGRLRWPF